MPNPRSLIFLLSAIALIVAPHSRHLSMSLLVFFFCLWIWRLLAVWRSRYLPNRLVLFLLTLFGAALLMGQHTGLFGRDAGTALFVVALGLKLLEIRSKRDVYLVVYLAFIAAASQFLYEQSFLMAAYILLVCTGLLGALLVQNAPQLQLVVSIKASMAIILQALPLAIVIFMLFPRLEAPRWTWLKDDNAKLTGLTDALEPGAISDLSLSEELVFRVRFKGDLPPPELRYWRGPVYSETDGVRWTMLNKYNHQASMPAFYGKGYEYTLLMEPQKQNWVFALEMAETFSPSLHRNAFFQLLTDKRPGERVEYAITSRTAYNTGALDSVEYRENLQLPAEASTKQLKLIRLLHGFEGTPELFIQNLLNHFRQEKFYYTLRPPLMPVDPIDTFLFETRSGFCSHYATAFVYLLRIANIPARVVGGYQGGEINRVGGFLEVRQADAHAWAEAWLDGKGWVRFDPTAAIAPERIEHGVDIDTQIASGEASFSVTTGESTVLSWLKSSRQLWQSIDYNWQHWVINYHGVSQMQFLWSLGIYDVVTLAKWLVGSVALITSILVGCLLKGKASSKNKALLYYRRFCTKMASAGIEIQLGEGAKDFAERVKKQRSDLSGQVEQITAIFIRLRYQANAEPGDLQALKTLVRDFRV